MVILLCHVFASGIEKSIIYGVTGAVLEKFIQKVPPRNKVVALFRKLKEHLKKEIKTTF
jgi:hypothetical protein